jgi:hypothetical protein
VTRPITFLSDYGSDDEFAGVCRAVIARIAPDARVIDLTHGIPPHDVAQGAAVLASSLAYAPAGIHLAVVDPGVGGDRRAIAVRVALEDSVLVGPDNGLLEPAVEMLGGAVETVDISLTPVRLPGDSATFHGRDLFAPVAGHLALGAPLAELGEPFATCDLVALPRPSPSVAEGVLRARVSHADRFGNLALAAGAQEAAALGLEPGAMARVRVRAGDRQHEAVFARAFADVPDGSLLVYVDASGALALAVNRASAAERLGVGGGDVVELETPA